MMRAAIVTGAASGIGHATAARLAEDGRPLVLVDQDAGGLDATIGELGAPCESVVGDVADPETAQRAVSAAHERFGGLEILINNAGIAPVGTVLETSVETWRRTLSVNLESVFLVSRAAITAIRDGGGGAIVNLASEAGLVGFERYAAYGASKAAIIGLTRCLALDHAADGIRVNCVCPGSIDTPLLQRYYDDQREPAAARREDEITHPLGIGRPEDIAEAVVYLASDRARYVTGHALVVDGGYTVR
jgi:meso-butanediol dehydrogenase / (S,S)-butanediol dehydrogenase / diacetyl reductase